MAPLVVLALGRALRRSTRRAGLVLAGVLVLANAILLAAYQGHVRIRLTDPDVSRHSVWASNALWQLPLPWGFLARDAPTAVPTIVLAVIALGAASIAVRGWRREPMAAASAWRHGALWAATGIVACLPPTVRWYARRSTCPSTTRSHSWGSTRSYASRADSVLRRSSASRSWSAPRSPNAAGDSRRARRGRRSRAWSLSRSPRSCTCSTPAAFGCRGSRASARCRAPIPSGAPSPDSRLLEALARPGGPLVEVPIGTLAGPDTSNDAPLQARAMYRSIFHRRPILNGYSSYWPPEFPERMAAVRRLRTPRPSRRSGARRTRDDPRPSAPLRRGGARALREATQRRSAGRALRRGFRAAERGAWRRLAAEGGRDDLRLVAVEGDDLLFAVTAP
jgi:hypothetical protein